MNLAIFYDTETTGLIARNERRTSPNQPHLVQLAAKLVDLDTRNTIQSVDIITVPHDFEIPPQTSAIHGITTEYALNVGTFTEKQASTMFLQMMARARVRIAHNQKFDEEIMQIVFHRYLEGQAYLQAPMLMGVTEAQCTADLATPILKLPLTPEMIKQGRSTESGYKRASLRESYLHFTGKEIVNAHTAMADVDACMAVYFAIEDLNADKEGSL